MRELGISLVEVLLVVAGAFFLLFLIASIPNSINLVSKSKHLSLAREIADKQVEEKRAMLYSSLVDGETSIVDPRINLLPSGNGKVLIEGCPIAICTNSEGEDVKQLTVTINWVYLSKDQSVALKTLISKGGLNN